MPPKKKTTRRARKRKSTRPPRAGRVVTIHDVDSALLRWERGVQKTRELTSAERVAANIAHAALAYLTGSIYFADGESWRKDDATRERLSQAWRVLRGRDKNDVGAD